MVPGLGRCSTAAITAKVRERRRPRRARLVAPATRTSRLVRPWRTRRPAEASLARSPCTVEASQGGSSSAVASQSLRERRSSSRFADAPSRRPFTCVAASLEGAFAARGTGRITCTTPGMDVPATASLDPGSHDKRPSRRPQRHVSSVSGVRRRAAGHLRKSSGAALGSRLAARPSSSSSSRLRSPAPSSLLELRTLRIISGVRHPGHDTPVPRVNSGESLRGMRYRGSGIHEG